MKKSMKIILRWIPSALIALAITASAIMKLAATTQMVEIYSGIGMLQYLPALGIAELLFTLLFLWPRSMKLGFCLLTGYFGGAMAVELSHGTIFIIPGLILVFIWVAAYLRDNTLFKTYHDPKGLLAGHQ